jgi:thymidylate synthase
MDEENQYLNLLRDIKENGIRRDDRTGVGTISIFGKQVRFSLRNDKIPLLTTKKMFIRGIFEELLFFLSGSTNSKLLEDKNVFIWKDNTSKEFINSRNLPYDEGDMGATYGHNFRHYGYPYTNMYENYDDKGFDQVKYVINEIKNNPTSRRIIINLWDPSTIHQATLPACAFLYQFYVDTIKKELSCHLVIRSSDVYLGLPWNYMTATFLVYMICNLEDIDLTPGELIVTTSDTHIYLNHLDQVEEQLSREPREFPKLKIKRKVKDILDFKFEDFELIDYKPHPSIKAKMAI